MFKPNPTRAKIIETSFNEFMTHGYHTTSLQKLADATGIAKASIYHYIKNKVMLLREALFYSDRKFKDHYAQTGGIKIECVYFITKMRFEMADHIHLTPLIHRIMNEAEEIIANIPSSAMSIGQAMEDFERQLYKNLR